MRYLCTAIGVLMLASSPAAVAQTTPPPTTGDSPSARSPANQPRETRIFFERDSTEIVKSGIPILKIVVKWAAEDPTAQIVLTGHTDRERPASYAVGLSQRMADSVRDYLISAGIDPGRIVTRAMGSSQPLVETADGVSETRNRRVHIQLVAQPVEAVGDLPQ
jgi:OmpA-OmpF porin, OOP family